MEAVQVGVLDAALYKLTNYKWVHAELHKRLMALNICLSDKPQNLHNECHHHSERWWKIVRWKQYKIFIPNNGCWDNRPMVESKIEIDPNTDFNEVEAASFVNLLMGRLS